MCKRSIISFFFLWIMASHSFGLLLAESSQPTRFSWLKANSRGNLELYGVQLKESGKGEFQFKKRNEESIHLEITLRPSAISTLVSLFGQSDFLNESKDFVSQRKVADMGTKTVRYETASAKREVVYNYTEDKGLQQISSFFENLCQQERALFEMDLALKYDRLGISKKLDELDRDLSDKRIVAPERFTQVLQKIYQDQSLMNLARKEAQRILSKIQKMQELSN